MRRSSRAVAALLVAALVVAVGAVLASGTVGSGDGSGPTPSASSSSVGGLPSVDEADLPPEARTTLALIDRGGPFPYDQDGTVFSNFEGLLPQEARGYYHEYTVETPGSGDRGARRIITGDRGEFYYTADHYESFSLIVRSSS